MVASWQLARLSVFPIAVQKAFELLIIFKYAKGIRMTSYNSHDWTD